MYAERSINTSIPLGVTIIFFVLLLKFFNSIFSLSSIPSTNSLTMVNASITVGTPILITGIPIVLLLISGLLLSTPDPGEIPVSEICMVVPSLSIDFAAKASIIITAFGAILSQILEIISLTSI